MSGSIQETVGHDFSLPAGVQATYYRPMRLVVLRGWYPPVLGEHRQMLLTVDFTLGEFLRGLGLTAEECREALEVPA